MTDTIERGYRIGSRWEPSWWERGLMRYALLSHSLWLRNIYWDTVRRMPQPKAGRLDPRMWWWEKKWVWLWGRGK